jgi:dihydroorotase
MTMYDRLIKDARIVNEGEEFRGHILIHRGKIHAVIRQGDPVTADARDIIDAGGRLVIPGIIDDQVHFREPGLTHKADIYTESRAALAGGTTSYMEMPNTLPQTTTITALEDKFSLASEKSMANYSFYLGATNDNLDEIRKLDPGQSCGVKIFMGSSTGNMLVDDDQALAGIFAESPVLIAVHCEDESIIRANAGKFRQDHGEDLSMSFHPLIRSEEACYRSSSKAVELAVRYQSRLHVLHVSTKRELGLFDSRLPVERKQVTAEVCVHHLWFDDLDYREKGKLIKWNPAIKTPGDKEGLRKGLLENRLDVIATDHAPHTLAEKDQTYFLAPSGGPLVQHALPAMMELCKKGIFGLPFLVEKMCHAPARIFRLRNRGFIREGYYADLVILEDAHWNVSRDNVLYKCGWSPFEGQEFTTRVLFTLVNGEVAYRWDVDHGRHIFQENFRGMRLHFNR